MVGTALALAATGIGSWGSASASAVSGSTVAPVSSSRPAAAILSDDVAGNLATKIAGALAEGAAGKIGNLGMGSILAVFGLNNEQESDLGPIRDQLTGIQNSLTTLQASTNELREEVSKGTYSELVAQTIPITADIDEGMKDLKTVSEMPAGDPTKENFTNKSMDFIYQNLMQGQQQQLEDRITGVAGAEGLVVAGSIAAKDQSPFWTAHTSEQVQSLFDYYQLYESRLLILSVNYMNAHPETYSTQVIQTEINNEKTALSTQQTDLLKPAAPCKGFFSVDKCDVIVDTRTNLMWDVGSLNNVQTGKYVIDARDNVLGGTTPQPGEWHFATVGNIQAFTQGWSGGNWETWLAGKVGGDIVPVSASFNGAWAFTGDSCPGAYPEDPDFEPNPCNIYAVSMKGDQEVFELGDLYKDPKYKGMVLVKEVAPNTYWWS